jgi:hypothetical protein
LLHLGAKTRDTAIMRRYGSDGALRDSLGSLAPFTRWRVAVALGDTAKLLRSKNSLPEMGPLNLQTIVRTALFDGLDSSHSADALRELRARPMRTSDRVRHLMLEHAVALNQGRLRDALSLTRRLSDLQPGSHAAQRLRVLDALYGGGDTAAVGAAALQLARLPVPTTQTSARVSDRGMADLCVYAQWKLVHRDTVGIAEAIRILRTSTTSGAHGGLVSPAPQACGILLDAALAVAANRSDARSQLEQIDSLALTVAAAGDASAYAHLWIARLHAALGDTERALNAVTRRSYMLGSSRYLAGALEAEAHYALSIGDTARAQRAVSHLGALRAEPDLPLRESLEALRATLRTRSAQ